MMFALISFKIFLQNYFDFFLITKLLFSLFFVEMNEKMNGSTSLSQSPISYS